MKLNLKKKTRISIYKMYAFIVLIAITGFLVTRGDKAESKIIVLADSIHAQGDVVNQLASENQNLEEKLSGSTQNAAPETTKAVVRYYLNKYFGDQAATAEKVFTCESGLRPNAVHVNNPGLGTDNGVAQLNDRWHKARFEKMYNVPFEVGAYDVSLNIQYAKSLYDHSGWGAWVCSRIVKV